MTDYARQVEVIKNAQTLDEIRATVRSFPAQAQGEGGILYSGYVGKVRSEVIAKELAPQDWFADHQRHAARASLGRRGH